MLTKKQHELLLFIHQRLSQDGVSPSFDEMKEALGLASKSGVHRLVSALEERGFIRRLPHRARALEVLKTPETGGRAAPTPAPSNVVEAPFGRSPAREPSSGHVDLPVLGKIAAGVPIEAIEREVDQVSVPGAMIAGGEHFALQVEGDSMIEAGILDGDTVIIRKADTANNGQIVVALVKDQEATLKTLRKKGGSVALEAANPDYKTQIYGPGEVKVQGTLAGLIRRYH